MKTKPTVLSMFSGCGGLDLGFHEVGYDILWANDFNEDACSTYEYNIGEIKRGKIENQEIPSINDLDVLLSGFPCQSFSNAGNRKGVNEDRGNLYKYTLKYIELLNPKFVVMENVRGLLSIKTPNGYLLPEICADLSRLGYTVKFKLLNTAHYGVPQNRLRVIIIAQKNNINLSDYYFPKAKEYNNLSIEETIFNLTDDFPNQTELLNLNPQALRLGSFVPEGGSWKNIPDEELPERLKKIRADMAKYRWPNFYRRYHRTEVVGTITAAYKPENAGVWHPTKDRIFSTREIARFQTFPDDFIFKGRTIKSNYEMIGNSVPPKLSKLIAKQLKLLLEGNTLESHTPVRVFSEINFGNKPVRVSDSEVKFDFENVVVEQLKFENMLM